QRIKDAIVDRVTDLGWSRPNVVGEEADLRVHAHLFKDRVTLSLDSSGAALRKRGWRVAQGRAPLAETMAAAMVLHSGWDGRSPLVDPFCGSGTLLIEAALWATQTAPGSFERTFGFQSWADYEPKLWKRLLDEARAQVKPLGKAPILGYDSSSQRITEARANLENAGFADKIVLAKGDATNFEAKRGWNAHILTNPPYGVRVGDEQQMVPLYMGFAKHLREVGAGYHLTLLTQPTLVASLGMPQLAQIPVRNGAIDCTLLKGDL
ncbi:MAG TPA: hypothetical protein P5218_14410, partial [Planctomycetota bacterium]|nr:hypothetical protein [Planctomycetota bacterium]